MNEVFIISNNNKSVEIIGIIRVLKHLSKRSFWLLKEIKADPLINAGNPSKITACNKTCCKRS